MLDIFWVAFMLTRFLSVFPQRLFFLEVPDWYELSYLSARELSFTYYVIFFKDFSNKCWPLPPSTNQKYKHFSHLWYMYKQLL